MKTYFTGGQLITPDQVFKNSVLIVEGEKISGISREPIASEDDGQVINVTGKYVVPGFIDLHFHGAMGASVMDATPEALHKISRFAAKFGVTSYLPTTWSAAPEVMNAAIDNVAQTPQANDGSRHLGVHVEGPYLSVEQRGAQRLEVIHKPADEEYLEWFRTGIVKLLTFAPEIEGAKGLLQEGLKHGVEFSIGHSGASFEQVIEAADLGVRQATHIFNGMLGLHHRQPGTVGGVLADDRIYAQLICDGIHIHPAVVKLIVRAKSPSRTILITDAIRGTGLEDGDFHFDGQSIIVRDGVARTPSGKLSGSTLTMDRAVRNAMAFAGLPIQEVLPMATSVPAEAMSWEGEKGCLKPGADADVVVLDEDYRVCLTMVAGKIVYQS